MEEITQTQSEQISGGFTFVLLRNLPERVFIDTTSPRYRGFSPAPEISATQGYEGIKIKSFL